MSKHLLYECGVTVAHVGLNPERARTENMSSYDPACALALGMCVLLLNLPVPSHVLNLCADVDINLIP